jgi:hypothetical protein
MANSLKLTLAINKQSNILDGITCYESADIEVIDKLLQTDLLVSNFKNPITRDMIGCEAKQLKRYKALIDRETGLAKVEYKRPTGMSFGRSNPKGALGMFNMRKQTRHTLATRRKLKDLDIINAFPTFLLQICKANGLACDKLDYYIKNRNDIIKIIMDATGCSRDRVKELFIALLFYGTFEYWLKEKKDKDGKIIYPEIDIYAFQNITHITQYIDELTAELKLIGDKIATANPKLVKEVEKNKDLKQKKNYNKKGSIVSFYLQEWEIRVLECLYQYCKEKEYMLENKVVLCADGLMLEELLIYDKDILTEFNAIVKEKIGFDLGFDTKELDESLTDEQIEEHIISSKNLDKTKFEIFNTDYFIGLNGYMRKKIYFEIFVAKILRPDPAYVYIEKEEGIEVMQFYSQGKITDAFNHLKTGEYYDNGEEVKFITKWLADEKIRCYNKMDFLPFNEKAPTPPHIFNLFRGFNENCKADYDYAKKDKLLKPFMELGVELCGGNQQHFTYFLKYLADIIQNPNTKNPIAFIIKGKQGTGKNVFLNAIGNVIGKHHYITSSNPKDFFGDYAEGFYHKLLVNMNECEGKDTFDFEGRIKSFITEDTITLNRKFVQPITIANLARLVIFTNKPNPIPIDIRSKERRYVIYETTDKYLDAKYGTQFWKLLVSHFNRPDFVACLYDYLNEYDLSNTDWRVERPITKAYMEMCRLYVPTEVLFLENILVKELQKQALFTNATNSNENMTNIIDWETSGIAGQELYKKYTDFAKEFGFYKDGATYQKNIKSFYCKLAELDLPIIQKKPDNLITYYFNSTEVLKVMKERKWIDRSDEDFKEETKAEIKGEDFTEYFEI